MAVSLLRLLPVFCLLVVTESASLRNCRSYIEGYDDPTVYCDADGTSSVHWTVVTETGITRNLGSCYGANNCSSPYNTSTIRLYSSSTQSHIIFYYIQSDFSGNLTCRVTLTNGNVDSDTCELKVVRVKIEPDVQDGRSQNIYCYNSPYTPSTVTWTLVTDSGQSLDLGTCRDVGSCTSPHSPSVTLTRPYNFRSRVYWRNVNRTLTGRLSCSYTYGGFRQMDTKPVNVYYPATVENCSVDISRHNWSAVLSCNITGVFSSAGLYEFRVYQYKSVFLSEDFVVRSTNGYIFGDRLSYRNGLTSYISTSDNKVYYNGSLAFSWHLPDGPVRYGAFQVDVYYGYNVVTHPYYTQVISIGARPNQPTHNCSELNYIPETGVVPCVCTAVSLGSPPGRLLWLLEDTPIASGAYDVNRLTFPSGIVRRQSDGMEARCELDWVQPISTALTSHVAYGPDNVTLQVTQSTDVSNGQKIHVISHVTAMKPMESDMVQWGGLCQGQQGFTCTLTPRSAAEVDGKAVTCRVANAANNGHSAEALVTIRLSELSFGNALTQSNNNSDDFNMTTAGLGTALGVVVIAFIVVMVVLHRRGRLCAASQPSPPPTPANDDESYYTSLNLAEVTQNKRRQQGVTCPSDLYQHDDRLYENTTPGRPSSHM